MTEKFQKEITVICDRCGIKVKGLIGLCPDACGGGCWTSGYYDLSDEYWKQFALNDKENKICDECMLKDLRYQNR